jgi:hypothetical protein
VASTKELPPIYEEIDMYELFDVWELFLLQLARQKSVSVDALCCNGWNIKFIINPFLALPPQVEGRERLCIGVRFGHNILAPT